MLLQSRMTAAKRIDGYLEEDDEIFRVDTIPPPDGDEDAYGAATKVGPLAKAKIDEMLKAAEANETMSPPPSAVRRKVAPIVESRAAAEESFEDAELTLEPTSLHPAALPAAPVVAMPLPKENAPPKVEQPALPVLPAPINLAPPYVFDLSRYSSPARPRRPSVMTETLITLAGLGVAASALVYWLF